MNKYFSKNIKSFILYIDKAEAFFSFSLVLQKNNEEIIKGYSFKSQEKLIEFVRDEMNKEYTNYQLVICEQYTEKSEFCPLEAERLI
jgi:hypothetical protein